MSTLKLKEKFLKRKQLRTLSHRLLPPPPDNDNIK